jgi:hypothetical protein
MFLACKNAQPVSKENALLQPLQIIVKLSLRYNEMKLAPKKPEKELHLNFFDYS